MNFIHFYISNCIITFELFKLQCNSRISFQQCVPEVNKDRSPLSRELIRPMFFFKCYKHKKLEACIMKDVREKYAGVTDEDLDGEMEIRRQGKAMKFDETEHEVNELATSMYDFLYGTESGVGIDEVV